VQIVQAMRTQNWIFEKPIEKMIVAGSVLWTVFSILKFLMRLII